MSWELSLSKIRSLFSFIEMEKSDFGLKPTQKAYSNEG